MKLAIASLLVGSAAAFAPAATPIRSSALNMATETATEKVRYKICKSIERIFGFRCLYMSARNATSILFEARVQSTLVTSCATICAFVTHLGYFVCSYLRLCSVNAINASVIISYAMQYAL